MELASVIIAGVALLIAITTFVSSRSSAAKANDAARRSAEASERSAAAAEAQTILATAAASRYVPPWELTFDGGSTYRLTNAHGGMDAYEVELSFSDDGPTLHNPQPPRDVGSRESITFMAAIYMGVQDRQLTVRWNSPDDEPKVWRSDLPAH